MIRRNILLNFIIVGFWLAALPEPLFYLYTAIKAPLNNVILASQILEID